MNKSRINSLFNIQYPIIQAGMVWCSGWRLASAISNQGGLGLIGAGSMYPEVLRTHVIKCKEATNNPFGVNLPLLYPDIEKHITSIIDLQVPIVFTSAGSPKKHTKRLQENGIKVAHVVSSAVFGKKSQDAGVDAIVAEGFEAGGHNGREETTSMCLIPSVVDAVEIPVIAAGGIGSGQAITAAMALGADGVQIGSLFAASQESSAHQLFKSEIIKANEGDTLLSLKQVVPVRLLKNDFQRKVFEKEKNGASIKDLETLLGRGRAKKGIFEGDVNEGELEIGQVSAQINEIRPASIIFNQLLVQYEATLKILCS
jgi:enoyl-[acyl-carrier protein] reductase II